MIAAGAPAPSIKTLLSGALFVLKATALGRGALAWQQARFIRAFFACGFGCASEDSARAH
jgi:hypothetical protein